MSEANVRIARYRAVMNWTPLPTRTMIKAMLAVFLVTFVVFLVCELLAVWTENELFDKLSSTALILSMAFFGIAYVVTAWKQPLPKPPAPRREKTVDESAPW